jgi:hypothetical protein
MTLLLRAMSTAFHNRIAARDGFTALVRRLLAWATEQHAMGLRAPFTGACSFARLCDWRDLVTSADFPGVSVSSRLRASFVNAARAASPVAS